MNEPWAEAFYWKQKYEDSQQEIYGYWKPTVDERQAVIDSYLQWFKEREHLSTMQPPNKGGSVPRV
jgi:hypothetical protein